MADQHESKHAVHSPHDADFVALEAPPPAADQLHQQDHDPHQTVAVRKLVLVTVIALVFMLMEFVGGYVAGSLAVISDAVHMLTDVLGFAIALTAIWIGRRPASDALSFGFHRVEVVGALVSILVIWVLTGVLVYSAAQRCREFARDDAEQVVDGKTMFIVALIGLVMNVVMMRVLGSDGHGHSHGINVGGGHGHSHGHSHGHAHGDNVQAATQDGDHEERHSHGHDHSHEGHDGHGHSHDSHDHEGHEETGSSKDKRGGVFASRFENLNIQAAYLHVLGDLLQSVGVTIAGAVIWWKPSWQLADPIMTFVFSLLVVATTLGTVRESLHILMEGTPRKVSYVNVERGLASCPDVVAVHDLHIWSLSSNKPALAVHLVSADPDASLTAAQHFLIKEGITHSTIQIERPTTEYPQQCAGERRCA